MRTEQQLVDKITFEELAYRNGKPNISDSEFEAYVDELRTFYPKNHILSTIVGEVISGTKVKLPVPMGSLEKIKTEEDLRKWIEHHNLMDEILVITPKYDGISIYKGQNLAITRGDEGIEGTDVTNRLLKTSAGYMLDLPIDVRGELVISKENFKRIAETGKYVSPRSAVVSLIGGGSPSTEFLRMIELKPFDLLNIGISSKMCSLDKINEDIKGHSTYQQHYGRDINHSILEKLYVEFGELYPIDGLVIEVDDRELALNIGYHTNSLNPKFKIAYKNDFEELVDTEIVEIIRQENKDGVLSPVAVIKPVILCGDTVSRIYLDNDRNMVYYGYGVGSQITVKKSGEVIPRIHAKDGFRILPNKEFMKQIKKHKSTEFQTMYGLRNDYVEPDGMNDGTIIWNDNGVSLITTTISDNVGVMKIVHFFKHIKVKDFKDSSAKILYDAGYETAKEILFADFDDIAKIKGFGDKKTQNLESEILRALSKVDIINLMHASGCFGSLGTTKLKLILDAEKIGGKKITDLTTIRGISDTSADSYNDGLEDWGYFYDDKLKAIVESKSTESIEEDKANQEFEFYGVKVAFTGFRNAHVVKDYEGFGGVYQEALKSDTSMLVYEAGTNAKAKLEKAEKKGIKIIERIEFEAKVNEFKDRNKTSFNSMF